MQETASKSVKPFSSYRCLIGPTRDEIFSVRVRFSIADKILLTSPVALNSQFIDNATMKFVNVHALLC
jgi:hypothetical protein